MSDGIGKLMKDFVVCEMIAVLLVSDFCEIV